MAFPNTWIAKDAAGRLEVFVVASGGGDGGGFELCQLYQVAPAAGWSQWVTYANPPGSFADWNADEQAYALLAGIARAPRPPTALRADTPGE